MFSFLKNIITKKQPVNSLPPEVKNIPILNSTETETQPKIVIQTPKTQEQLEEIVIEKWLDSKKNPSTVNHYELIYSGVNMDRFSNLEAKVGKFNFKRNYFGDNWHINIDEK